MAPTPQEYPTSQRCDGALLLGCWTELPGNTEFQALPVPTRWPYRIRQHARDPIPSSSNRSGRACQLAAAPRHPGTSAPRHLGTPAPRAPYSGTAAPRDAVFRHRGTPAPRAPYAGTVARRYPGTPDAARRASYSGPYSGTVARGYPAPPPSSQSMPCPSACHYGLYESAATLIRHGTPATLTPGRPREPLLPGAAVRGAPDTECRRIVSGGRVSALSIQNIGRSRLQQRRSGRDRPR